MKNTLWILLFTAGVCLTAVGQTGAPAAPPADQLVEIIASRSVEDIAADAERMEGLKERMTSQMARTRELLSKSAVKIEVKEKEIELLEARIDEMEKAKNEAEASKLEAEVKVAEAVLAVLKAEEDLREAELEAEEAEQEYYEGALGAYRMEKELARKRGERMQVAAGTAPAMLGALIRELETKTLEAQIQASELRRTSAARATSVLNRQRQVMEAQNTLLTGR
jgi:hypothetical protein